MLHKKHLEKQINDEVLNDLFKIFINSKSKKEFITELKNCNYKEPQKVWSVFFPKYDEYRQENLKKFLEKNDTKVLH